MHPSRPLTHDLMKNFMSAFTIDLQEIISVTYRKASFYIEAGMASAGGWGAFFPMPRQSPGPQSRR